MITFLTISICILAVIIVILIFMTLLYKSALKKAYQRKVEASDELISTIENEMIRALHYGNMKKYEIYRDIFNDLSPSRKETYMY